MKEKTIDKVHWNVRLFGWVLLCLISALAISHSIVLGNIIDKLEGQETIDVKNFTETLEIINDNCGSTFLTKPYGKEDFNIYKQVCNSDGYCKYEYLTIESCLGDALVLEDVK